MVVIFKQTSRGFVLPGHVDSETTVEDLQHEIEQLVKFCEITTAALSKVGKEKDALSKQVDELRREKALTAMRRIAAPDATIPPPLWDLD